MHRRLQLFMLPVSDISQLISASKSNLRPNSQVNQHFEIETNSGNTLNGLITETNQNSPAISHSSQFYRIGNTQICVLYESQRLSFNRFFFNFMFIMWNDQN